MTPSAAPPFPENADCKRLTSGGVHLYVAGVPGDGESGTGLFLVPGYTDHVGRYGELFSWFQARGTPVWGADLRGHGRSSGRRGEVARFTDYLDDLAAALKHAAERSGIKRWILLGHSTGALVVLSALMRRPHVFSPQVSGVVLSSPLLSLRLPVPLWRQLVAQMASVLMPRLSLPTGVPHYANSHDQVIEKARREDPLVFTSVNARWVTESATEMAWVRARPQALKTPVLCLQAGSDRVVEPSASRAFTENCPHGTYVEYPEMYHEVLLESDRRRIWGRIAKWSDGLP